MALTTGRRVPARHIGVNSGRRVYAAACGRTVCQEDSRFAGRHVAVAPGGKRVYAVASDGCQLPLDLAAGLTRLDETCVTRAQVLTAAATEPFFVEPENFAPNGLSRVLRAELRSVAGCPDLDCVGAYLLYNEPDTVTLPAGCSKGSGTGVWTGCFQAQGGLLLPVKVYYDPSAGPGTAFQACVGGPDTLVNCREGVEAVLSGPGSTCGGLVTFVAPIPAHASNGTPCCECPGGQFSLGIRSFCRNYRLARHIATVGGRRVFGVTDCLGLPTCTPATDCCALLDPCTLTASVEVDGECCADLAVTRSLFPATGTKWSSFGVPLTACSRNWTIEVTCSNNNELTMEFFNTDVGATCTSVSETVVADPCWPLDVTFHPEFTCSFGNPDFPDKCTPSGVTVRVTS